MATKTDPLNPNGTGRATSDHDALIREIRETPAAIADEFSFFIDTALPPKRRSVIEFAESEIILPDGPYQGLRFRADRQPVNRLWFAEIERDVWRNLWATGPSQSSKTLVCVVIVALYHLFELGETIIFGLPDENMAFDKWSKTIKPVLERTKYCDQIPNVGRGVRGGVFDSITFLNGATLKFMTGGGGDKSRSHFTARVVFITEADGMAGASSTSVEADPITQIKARTRAFKDRARTYGECTVTTKTGRTWQEITVLGSNSRIVVPCPRCGVWIAPGRQDLKGWEAAENELQACELSKFYCPECDEPMSDDDRITAVRDCRLVHAGQEIKRDGTIVGDLPPTRTLGFKPNGFTNLFTSAGELGVEEWQATRVPDEENAERELCQFAWAFPYEPLFTETEVLESEAVCKRSRKGFGRGLVPDDTDTLVVGVDTGKRVCHFVIMAGRADGRTHIVDYGRFDVPTDDIGIELALRSSLRDFRDLLADGRPTETGPLKSIDAVFIDSGYAAHTEPIYAFCRESDVRIAGRRYRKFWPMKGYGEGQQTGRSYMLPKSTGAVIKWIGDEMHISKLKRPQPPPMQIVEINADAWKCKVHDGLRVPPDNHGAMTIFQAMPREHTSFAKHLTAEEMYEEFDAKRGKLTHKWRRIGHRSNHWLDATYEALAAVSFVRTRRTGRKVQPDRNRMNPPGFTMDDGRPFFVGHRQE